MKHVTFFTTVALALSATTLLPSSSQKGLMGGLGLQGTKITEYTPSA
jgi:hypothetical protein